MVALRRESRCGIACTGFVVRSRSAGNFEFTPGSVRGLDSRQGWVFALAHPHHPLIDLPESWARPGGPVRDVPRRFVSWQNAADDYGLHALHPNSVEGESVEL